MCKGISDDQPRIIVTDKLRSYRVAMVVIGNADRQETGRWVNKRAENSHLPFRRQERAMLRFRRAETLIIERIDRLCQQSDVWSHYLDSIHRRGGEG